MFGALPEWVGSLARDLGLIAAILTALAVIYRTLVRPTWQTWQRIDQTVRHVHEQLVPNGGTSLRDAVNRLEQQHADLAVRLDAVDQSLCKLTRGVD